MPGKWKLNDVLIGKLAAEVHRHNNLRVACLIAGISEQQYYRWIRAVRAGRGTELQKKLMQQVELAKAQWIADRVTCIQRAGQEPRNWAANAWLLERSFPLEYGLKKIEAALAAAAAGKAPVPDGEPQPILIAGTFTLPNELPDNKRPEPAKEEEKQ